MLARRHEGRRAYCVARSMRIGYVRLGKGGYFARTYRTVALTLFALVLGYFVPHIRERWLPWMGTDLGRDQLIAFLASVATGMMAFTGVVLSLLFVLLQLGTGYTPRIVSSWMKDPRIANATGVFTGTFVYSLMALRAVGLVQGSRSCALTSYVAFAWLLASLWILTRLWIVFAEHDHAHVLRMLRQQGSDAIDRVYAMSPPSNGCRPPPESEEARRGEPIQAVVHDGPPLYVVRIHVEPLVRLARERGAVIRVPFAQGDSVPAGVALALVYGRTVPPRRVLASIELGLERDVGVDPKYALRLLVDVALRALSSSTNDPTTAVQALDQIESLLIKLGNRELDVGQVRDGAGALRVVHDATTWEEYLDLALAEIQQCGAASLQTERRLGALLTCLHDHVPLPRRAAIDRLTQQHVAVVAEALRGPPLLVAARGDRQGLGHTLQ
jgi:uncharacterized membrane protein